MNINTITHLATLSWLYLSQMLLLNCDHLLGRVWQASCFWYILKNF